MIRASQAPYLVALPAVYQEGKHHGQVWLSCHLEADRIEQKIQMQHKDQAEQQICSAAQLAISQHR